MRQLLLLLALTLVASLAPVAEASAFLLGDAQTTASNADVTLRDADGKHLASDKKTFTVK